ncbi:MAG: hypothetical protein WAT37_10095 [Saprospiraceae bacterium]
MYSVLIFLFNFNIWISPAVDDNKFSSTTENIVQTGAANKAAIDYADVQIIHLKQLADMIDGFLSSGHTTGSNINGYKMASTSLKQGIKELNTTKVQISKMVIKDVATYTATLVKIHDIGKKYFDKGTKLIGLKKDGQNNFTTNGEITIGPNCLSVRSEMKAKCLEGIQRMSDCGIYVTLGLTRMLDDQEKCDGKANAAMLLCAQSDGSYNGWSDAADEITKAEMACAEHEKLIGSGSQLQTQTWDGF